MTSLLNESMLAGLAVSAPRNSSSLAAPCQPNMSVANRLLIVAFALIFCLSVLGNSLVIVTIIQQRSMRTVTNLYLLNLAIADLLLCIVCMPPTLLAILLQCFLFGQIVCKLVAFLQRKCLLSSLHFSWKLAF